ncbi:uncharacterized protein LOC116337541 [Contarinia nasturtii]|uniref:uncharacterized protein LOC116337541 n=1 Tax=Contarinia nasturtii TaxID=265458 RepID=UPI0012D4A840|nr:uncharacterized protein LOC116337541 [Contarinia nasturtii]
MARKKRNAHGFKSNIPAKQDRKAAEDLIKLMEQMKQNGKAIHPHQFRGEVHKELCKIWRCAVSARSHNRLRAILEFRTKEEWFRTRYDKVSPPSKQTLQRRKATKKQQ